MLGSNASISQVYVLKKPRVPLLSRRSCIKFGLLSDNWPQSALPIANTDALSIPTEAQIKPPSFQLEHNVDAEKHSIIAEYPMLFQEEPFRAMTGPAMHIDLRRDAMPCRHLQPRTIPLRWRETVETQLTTMVAKGAIEKVPVGESYDWGHTMVVVPKRDSSEPRITVDLTG